MKLTLAAILLTLLIQTNHVGRGAEREVPDPNRAKSQSRFTHVDLYIDPKGQPLAAWQLEFAAETGDVSLVGVEAGQHPAFAAKPPYYDPAALAGKRIILADFTLNPDLPNQKTRIARLMLETKGDATPHYATKLITAADSQGKRITAELTVADPATQPRSGDNK
jgi:hypothetical protein